MAVKVEKLRNLTDGDLTYRLKKALQNETVQSSHVQRILSEVRSRKLRMPKKLRDQLEYA